jgi:NitT/TauT family transport system substrate-binding protein
VRRACLLLILTALAAIARAEPITIAIVPSVPAASTLIAADKGYFRDAGLDVNIERIDSMGKAVAFLAANHVQVAQGGINAGIFNAIAQGLPIVLALDGGSTPLYHRILLRRGLEGEIRTMADLKGRSVGLSAPGSTSMYEMAMTLARAGLTLHDVDVKNLAFAQMTAALQNGALDVALAVAPFTALAVERNIAVPWLDPEEGYIATLPMTSVAYIINTDWAAKNPDVARRLLLALARGSRDYCQAYHHGPNRGEILDVLVKKPDRERPRLARSHGLAGAQSGRPVQPREPRRHPGVFQTRRHHRQDRPARAPGRPALRGGCRAGVRAV